MRSRISIPLLSVLAALAGQSLPQERRTKNPTDADFEAIKSASKKRDRKRAKMLRWDGIGDSVRPWTRISWGGA